ncbi:MAG: choice-of-anchor D domain-containing protein [Vicinamibacterales bacterium]
MRSAALVAAALGLAASNATAQSSVHLIAAPVTKAITLPNGTVVSVPMWGYAVDTNDNSLLDGGETVSVPGPRITVPVGGNLTVKLTNLLPEATSLVIPGQPFAIGAAVPDRNADGRARSMTAEAVANSPGTFTTYTFTGLKPGTFLYQSGSHPAVQVQMGLYGAMTKDSAAGEAYAGVLAAGSQPAQPAITYQNEAVLLFSEIDQALHDAVAGPSPTYGTTAGPTSTVNYRPSIFLINGESYTNAAMATMGGGNPGQVTLLRLLNAGLVSHAPVLDNGSLQIVAEDGNKLPFAKGQATLMLAAGKTHDALWTPAADGVYSLYDRLLGLNAPGQPAAGMLAKLNVGTGVNSDPVVAANDSAGGYEDLDADGNPSTSALAAAITGNVLGNDTNATAAELITSTSAGLLTLLPGGSFTYIPNANFFGVDSFTYRASDGTNFSKSATVLITVASMPDAPIASSPTLGVDFNGNANVMLSATDADGDALKYYLTALPTNGALSYINPLTKVETSIVAGNLRTVGSPAGTGGLAIPGGNVLYRPTAGYSGPDTFQFVASDGGLDSTVGGQVNATVYPTDEDTTTGLTAPVALLVKGNDGSTISNYRWTLEEDTTYKVIPGLADPNTLAVRFHTSFTPVAATGTEADPVLVNPLKRYFVSVLPTENNYSNTGGEIEVGVNALTVVSSKLPLPTARIRVQVFEDNAPLDGMVSGTEANLQGFQVTIDDAGGTYGMSGGPQSTDAMGNKIGTTYEPCDPGPCDSYQVTTLGNGFVLTDENGIATIENLPMGKYTVKVRAPGGDKWIQTTTIEGQPGIDAWVKPNEPKFFAEFGPPGPHVLVGFVKASSTIPPAFQGTGSITGRITNMRMGRPPDMGQSSGAPYGHTRPWVALNSAATAGQLLFAQPVNEDGTFAISNVADGNYSLVVFDSALDIIIASRTVDVVGGAQTPLADVPVFAWFANLYSYVYEDNGGDAGPDSILARNGHRDPGEPGMADQALNIRFRDGSIYQSLSTSDSGFKAFNEVFPFFAWLVAEVDYARFHSTGVTVVVDAGGTASATNDWQTQAGLPAGLIPPNVLNPQPQAENGGAPFRDESGAETPFLLLEGFQAFLGQSNVMLWGKAPYEKVEDVVEDVNVAPFDDFPGPGDTDANGDGFFNTDRTNGGIAGIVHYTITRAENDPRWATAENWEPGVSDVRIQLWDENRTHMLNEAATDNWNNSLPAGCQGAVFTFLGQATDCYDGLRNFNQARPALFDGGYAFSTILEASPARRLPGQIGPYSTNIRECVGSADVDCRDIARPIPAQKYVVKMIPPPGYKVQKEEDKNVDFGDQYIPQQFWIDGYPLADAAVEPLTQLASAVLSPTQTTITLVAGGGKTVHPNDVINVVAGTDNEAMRVVTVVGDSIGVLRAQAESTALTFAAGADVYSHDAQPAPTASDNALIAPFCVGSLHTVPNELSLFPGVFSAFGGEQKPLCDAKLVVLREGQQAAPDFHLLTDAPKAGHIYGMVLDDTTNEFDPNAPNFGEKYAPPYMPIAIRDWQGREIAHTYTDQYGMYNALVPSTYTIQVPQPSGVAPSILQACINSPTMAGPDGTVVAEPLFQKQYSHFCYPLQYLPGKTTYLDTPVLPTGAFTGTGTFPVDAELPNRTPIIASVTGAHFAANGNVATAASSANPFGPYIVDNGAADDAARTIKLKSAGKIDVVNPAYDGPGSAQPKLIQRDYGFGSPSTLNGAGFVTLGGQRIPYTAWSDTEITVVVPALPASPTPAQLAMSRTGELAVERCLAGKSSAINTITGKCNDGRKSVLGVTLNVATNSMHQARAPKVVNAGESIQAAIDAATPGDLILVNQGTYEEMVVMSKPVRLQGAGALSTIINVVTTPAENLQAWLDNTGNLLLANPDYLLPTQPVMTPGPFTTGDLAAVLGDEGAGVTVLGKNLPTEGLAGVETGVCMGGFDIPLNQAYCLHNENSAGDAAADVDPTTATRWLRPNARIDGFSIIGTNDAPGIRVNGNNHYLEISNNKIFTNTGNFAGGIELGHVGRPDLQDQNAHVQFSAIHNNVIAQNAGLAATGGSGIVLGTGAGMYRVFENFIAGNLTAGQGAGISHIGNTNIPAGSQEARVTISGVDLPVLPTYWGTTTDVPSIDNNVSVIDRNTVVFNESFSQGVTTNGGGIFIGGTPPPVGGTTTGSGAVRVSNNLIQGNAASGGDGGGIALVGLNGFNVGIFNNVIANNVASWAGGGISLQNTGGANVEIVHDTIVNNDSLAVAGAAFTVVGDPNRSAPQPAGIFVRNAGVANNPKITNSIVWHNRSYYFGVTSNGGLQIPGTTTTRGLIACSTTPCIVAGPTESYWDTGRTGSTSVLTMSGTTTGGAAAPAFLKTYVNVDRRNSYQQAEVTTILAPAALDEGGNFIRPQFGPLSLTKLDDTRFSNYHTSAGVNGVNLATGGGGYGAGNVPAALTFDIDSEPRPATPDRGADEVVGIVALPVANTETVDTDAGVAATITVLTNDTPLPLTVTGVSQVVGGTATTNGTTVVFTPDAGFNGQGSFIYSISGVGGEASVKDFVNVGTPAPVLSLAPTFLNFANVSQGSTSAAKVVTVTNTGNDDLTISSISIAGADVTQYAITGDTCAGTLAPGFSCNVSVAFSPASLGSKSALLNVAVGAPAVSASATLSGIGVGTILSVDPSSLTFVAQTVNQPSAAQLVTLTNTGNTFAEFTMTVSTGDFAAESDTCPAGTTPGTSQVVAGGSCTVAVTFTPAAPAGLKTGTLTLTPSIGASTVVALSGEAAALNVTAAPSPLLFGNVVRNTPTTLAVTITNAGTAPVQLLASAISGTNANQFTRTSTCPVAPAALPGSGATCTVNVVFTATTLGVKNATLTVTPLGNPAMTIPMSGTGVNPLVTLTTTNFGAVALNQPKTLSVTATAPQGPATITAFTRTNIAGAGSAQFTIVAGSGTCGTLPITLADEGSCTVDVKFAPLAPIDGLTRSATINATVTGGTGAGTAGNLSGTAAAPVLTISPNALAFGDQPVSVASAPQAITIDNAAGTGPVTIATVAFSSPRFSRLTPVPLTACGTSVAAGASCTIDVVFTPNAVGSVTAGLQATIAGITNTPITTSSTTGLTGNGVAPTFTVAPSLGFGNQEIGLPVTLPVTVSSTNAGTGTSTFSVSISGGAGQFSATGCTAAVGSSCQVNVTFVPSSAGLKTATLNVSTPSGGPSTPVALTGTGVVGSGAGPHVLATVFGDTQGSVGATATVPAVPAGTLLVAFVSADAPATGSNTVVNQVTDVAGLTWTNAVRSNAQRGTAEIWWAYSAAARANGTVTAALSANQAASITVVAFSGAASSLAACPTCAFNGASGAPTGSLTTTGADSLVFAVGTDWSNPRTLVPGADQGIVHRFAPTVGDTYWVQRTNAAAASGTSVTMSDTYSPLPMTDVWNLAVIEIKVP